MAMSEQPQPVAGAAASTTKARTSFGILGAISLSHLLNDMIQSLILAIYPLLQSEFSLTFMQIGMITLTFQLASSLLQPVVGYWTDKYPMPWSLPIGMCFTLSGLVLLALAGSFGAVLLAAALVGTGSSVFHPESSRVARMASGGRHGLAQSIFQVGGNFGSSLGPLLAAVIIAPYGKGNVAWFVLAALLAIVVLAQISRWYSAQHRMNKGKTQSDDYQSTAAQQSGTGGQHSVNPHFLEIFLYGEHQQLLHLLSDAKIRIIYPECSASSVCLPVCRCGRYGDRRACRG